MQSSIVGEGWVQRARRSWSGPDSSANHNCLAATVESMGAWSGKGTWCPRHGPNSRNHPFCRLRRNWMSCRLSYLNLTAARLPTTGQHGHDPALIQRTAGFAESNPRSRRLDGGHGVHRRASARRRLASAGSVASRDAAGRCHRLRRLSRTGAFGGRHGTGDRPGCEGSAWSRSILTF